MSSWKMDFMFCLLTSLYYYIFLL